MTLRDELRRVAELAAGHAGDGEEVAAVLATEPMRDLRVYLCAFARDGGEPTWLALDADGAAIDDRALVREASSLAAVCEVAGDSAGGGHLDELRSRLAALRVTENPDGIDEAEEAAAELERLVGAPPRVATAAWLDDVGRAARRLEQALGDYGRSPFAEAMQAALPAVEALTQEVEAAYKKELR
jgi:hypothetical protein